LGAGTSANGRQALNFCRARCVGGITDDPEIATDGGGDVVELGVRAQRVHRGRIRRVRRGPYDASGRVRRGRRLSVRQRRVLLRRRRLLLPGRHERLRADRGVRNHQRRALRSPRGSRPVRGPPSDCVLVRLRRPAPAPCSGSRVLGQAVRSPPRSRARQQRPASRPRLRRPAASGPRLRPHPAFGPGSVSACRPRKGSAASRKRPPFIPRAVEG